MGLFVTINPYYLKKNDLSENIKLLLRPISMIIPDYNEIAINILYSEGKYL